MAQKLLLVDDDTALTAMLRTYLEGEGYRVECADGGNRALERVKKQPPALLVLDVMMPGLDGFETLRRLRQFSSLPVIMLTAKGDDTDRIVGLEMGADDYLAKPFNPRELLARIRAVLRRGKRNTEGDEVVVVAEGRIVLDQARRRVLKDGEAISLTGRQFDLLVALLNAQGRVLSREQLMNAVTGEGHDAFDRSIDVHISKIRQILEDDPKNPSYLKSVRGVGYVWAES